MVSLKQYFRTFILKHIPVFVSQEIISKYQKNIPIENSSFAQEGEDKLLLRYIGKKEKGFYIDIGAHHPIRFSNTYLFYLKGWKGINIDAMPGSMRIFQDLRPNDINLEIPISNERELLKYHIFNETALNTFSEKEAEKMDGHGVYKIVKKVELETLPLSSVLDQYLPRNTAIDFLSIDVEGLDFQVLKSNNWEKYKPYFILIEELNHSVDEIMNNEIYNYLKELNYHFIAKTANTLFFKRGI